MNLRAHVAALPGFVAEYTRAMEKKATCRSGANRYVVLAARLRATIIDVIDEIAADLKGKMPHLMRVYRNRLLPHEDFQKSLDIFAEAYAELQAVIATRHDAKPAATSTPTSTPAPMPTLDTFKQGTDPQKAAAKYIEAVAAGTFSGTQKSFLGEFNRQKRNKVKLPTFKNAISDIREKLKLQGSKIGSKAP